MKINPIAIAVPVLILLSGCGPRREKPDGSGTIECTQVQVASQVPGRIIKFPAREGAVLKEGDPVAALDPTDYEFKRDEARAGLAQAQAQLDLLLAGSRDEDIARARDLVREAQASATAAEADFQRVKQVFEKKSATPKQMDEARARFDRTTAALSAAEQNLSRLLRGNREEEIRAARARLDQGKARLALAEKAVADCVVTSPLAGVVTTRIREEGEVVGAGAPLVTVSRLDEVWLSIYIPEDLLPRVKPGQAARVKVDGDPAFREGTVTFISPEAEFTPKDVQTPEERAKLVYRVKITLPNPDGVFKPGMPGDGYLGADR